MEYRQNLGLCTLVQDFVGILAASNQTGNPISYMDRNLYFNTRGNFVVARDNSNPVYDLPWAEFIEEMKIEQNSLVADPLFENECERNYALRENSPAFSLGFKRIDQTKIGLLEIHPMTDQIIEKE